MILPSASALARAAHCPASTVLPQEPDTGGEDAERGQCLHGYAEASVNGVDEATALATVPEAWRETARGLDVVAIMDALGWNPFGNQVVTTEEAFAFDVRLGVGRSLGCSLGRDYSGAKPGEAVGTADVVIFDRDTKRVVVADYKFGHGFVERADRNWQLRSLALYAAARYEADTATVVAIRAREDGGAWFDTADIDEAGILEIHQELRELADRIERDRAAPAGAAPVTGEHCRYCRSAPHCPTGPMAMTLAEGSGLKRLGASPEGRRRLLEMLPVAKRIEEIIEGELRSAIERGDASLPGGDELCVKTTEKRKVGDADEIFAAVRELLGDAAAEVAAPMARNATVTTLKAAAKLGAAKGEATKAGDRLLAELTTAGLVRASVSESIGVRKAMGG